MVALEKDMQLFERLSALMNEKGTSIEKLRQVADVTYEMARRYKLGIAEPRKDKLEKIAEYFGVTPSWLQFGEGEKEIIKQVDDVEMIEPEKDYSDTHISIDLYDIKLSAGNGKPVIEWMPRKSDEPLLFREAWFRFKRLSPKNCKAMYVRGQSMAPVLQNWDTVIVDISDTEIVDGEIYALIYENNLYIKQIVRTGKGIDLISFNPEYEPIKVNNEDLNDLQIIGRKVWRGG